MTAGYHPYDLELLANEAFLRRAALVDAPFMLKGSLVTRQYMTYPSHRIPGDMDWVYLEKLEDTELSEIIFNDWVCEITNMKLDDDVHFVDFNENAFWRGIDYSMSEDFPTVNTDLDCLVKFPNREIEFTLGLDISFNLDIDFPSVPLNYLAKDGSKFLIEKTTPLSLQVAWKLHQTITRPRFKDLYDLIFLLTHELFSSNERQNALQALVNECYQDGVDLERLSLLLSGNWDRLFAHNSLEGTWMFWRMGEKVQNRPMMGWEQITDSVRVPKTVPEDLATFKQMVLQAFEHAGFKNGLELPKPTAPNRKRRLRENFGYYVNYNRNVSTEATKPWWQFW